MKKLFIALLIFSGISLFLNSRGITGQSFFRNLVTGTRDTDPNSKTKQMAKRHNDATTAAANARAESQAKLDSDLVARLSNLGLLPLNLQEGQTLVFLFNDSKKPAVFQFTRSDKSKITADVTVPAKGYRYVTLGARDQRAYVKVQGRWREWDLPLHEADAFGCFHR